MYHETANYQINSLDAFVEKHVLAEAKQAVEESSYGVGGALVNLKSGAIIKTMHNTVIARESTSEQARLKDPTAHGERQLVDWYFANKTQYHLPEPVDILLVTSLDPCLMCTGSILSAGFRVAIVALDSSAGINWEGDYTFSPLEGSVLEQTKKTFIYPVVTGDPSRTGYGTLPLFTESDLSKAVVNACFAYFDEGAQNARPIVKNIIPKNELRDVTASSTSEAKEVVAALRAEYSSALNYTSKTGTSIPDEGLAPYLIKAAMEDIQYGGDGDAVAFLDYFGNLMMCKSGKKSISPIRSAFMETARAYQKVRYELSRTSNSLLKYLCDPSFGTFVFVKGFDKSAPSFADMGAYGSVMLNAPDAHNLQYITPRIKHSDLLAYIGGMPKRYKDILKPEVVSNAALIAAVENGVRPLRDYERYIDIPFPQNYYLEASVSMQAANRVLVRLADADDGNFYFNYTNIKDDSCNDGAVYVGSVPQALTGYPQLRGVKQRLFISIKNCGGKNIKYVENFRVIKDSTGAEKALEYSLHLEDATDNDYNDLHVTLTAWKKKD